MVTGKGSAPINCTLPHIRALAQRRKVRRNIHSNVASTRTPHCGVWVLPLEAGLELLFQGDYPRYQLISNLP